MKKLRGVLVLVVTLALCVVNSACVEAARKTKKSDLSTKAYERANDRTTFKRTVETKDRVAKKAIKTQDKLTRKKAGEAAKGKKKGFLWW